MQQNWIEKCNILLYICGFIRSVGMWHPAGFDDRYSLAEILPSIGHTSSCFFFRGLLKVQNEKSWDLTFGQKVKVFSALVSIGMRYTFVMKACGFVSTILMLMRLDFVNKRTF